MKKLTSITQQQFENSMQEELHSVVSSAEPPRADTMPEQAHLYTLMMASPQFESFRNVYGDIRGAEEVFMAAYAMGFRAGAQEEPQPKSGGCDANGTKVM